MSALPPFIRQAETNIESAPQNSSFWSRSGA